MPNVLHIFSKKFPALREHASLLSAIAVDQLQIDASDAARLRKVLATIPDDLVDPITEATERFIRSFERACQQWVRHVGRHDLDAIMAKALPLILMPAPTKKPAPAKAKAKKPVKKSSKKAN